MTLTEQGARFGYMSRQSEDDEAHPSPNHVKVGLRPETEDLQWQRPSPSHYPDALLRPEATEGRKRLLYLHLDYITEAKEDAYWFSIAREMMYSRGGALSTHIRHEMNET
jgi:hypothetical protein